MLEGLSQFYMVVLHILSTGKLIRAWWAQPSGWVAISWFVVFILIADMFLPFAEKFEILVKVKEDFFFFCFSNCDNILMIMEVFLAGIFLFRGARRVWLDVHC